MAQRVPVWQRSRSAKSLAMMHTELLLGSGALALVRGR
jgi:hypothetical protein